MSQEAIDRLREKAQNEQTVIALNGLLGLANQRIEELERQLAERDAQQEKDAARYRFARDVGCNFVWAVIGAGECRSGLDEAIDARIAALSAQANQEKANG